MVPRRAVFAFLKGGLATFALLGLCLLVVPLTGKEPCRACRGSGFRVEEEFVDRCSVCDGTGSPDSLESAFRRNEKEIGDSIDAAAVLFWMGLGLLVSAGLIAGLRAGECPLCRGSGRLVYEVRPRKRKSYRADLPCDVCEGKGGVTAIDRWLAGV
ncbi:MAG: hypothetical protein HY293_00525 [Planctomycetes bacterium]|nr:hypothetical protein [Planctomycetota bacterium]